MSPVKAVLPGSSAAAVTISAVLVIDADVSMPVWVLVVVGASAAAVPYTRWPVDTGTASAAQ